MGRSSASLWSMESPPPMQRVPNNWLGLPVFRTRVAVVGAVAGLFEFEDLEAQRADVHFDGAEVVVICPVRLWRMALSLDFDLPSVVRGPVHFSAFFRLRSHG
jgi:hypothetical protein